MRLVTPLEMMKLEDRTNKSGISYDQMMERAGTGLAEHLAHFAMEQSATSLLFICGNGNNAGDCFVAATQLADRYAVTVALAAGIPKTRTAYTKYKMMKDVQVLTDQDQIREAVSRHHLIVDGVFGIGFRGELNPFIRELFGMVNADPAKQCIAVDIPSGGSGLNGSAADGTPHCVMTVTFGAAKAGLFLEPLSEYCGAILLVDIGIPETRWRSSNTRSAIFRATISAANCRRARIMRIRECSAGCFALPAPAICRALRFWLRRPHCAAVSGCIALPRILRFAEC